METLSLDKAMDLVYHATIALNEPVMLWGPPGIGKSQGVASLALKLDAALVDVRLSQYDSVDLRGFPGVDPETNHTVWHPPSTLPFVANDNFPDDRLIILFFDEINAAPPPVAAVAYQIINENRCGEHILKPNVRIVSAGNRETDKGVTNRMPLPLANRFTHVNVTQDVEPWAHWAQENGVPMEGIAFMHFRRPLLNTFDPSKPEKAFATPRTWEKAFKYYLAEMPRDIKMAAMIGAVGEGPAREFWGFVDVWQKIPDINDILKDPKKARVPSSEDPSTCYAVAINVSGNMTTDNADALHTYLLRLDPEYAVLAWNMATTRDTALYQTDAFINFTTKFKSIILNN